MIYYNQRKERGKLKHEIFYTIGNQKAIGYFTDNEIDYLRKNTSIEIINIKRGN